MQDLEIASLDWSLEKRSFEAAIWRMNFKARTFGKLTLISLKFGRGAQKWIDYTASVDIWHIHFLFGTLQALGSHQSLRYFEEDASFFEQCETKIVRRHTSRQRSSVASQQCLCPRRFEGTVKRIPKTLGVNMFHSYFLIVLQTTKRLAS